MSSQACGHHPHRAEREEGSQAPTGEEAPQDPRAAAGEALRQSWEKDRAGLGSGSSPGEDGSTTSSGRRSLRPKPRAAALPCAGCRESLLCLCLSFPRNPGCTIALAPIGGGGTQRRLTGPGGAALGEHHPLTPADGFVRLPRRLFQEDAPLSPSLPSEPPRHLPRAPWPRTGCLPP